MISCNPSTATAVRAIKRERAAYELVLRRLSSAESLITDVDIMSEALNTLSSEVCDRFALCGMAQRQRVTNMIDCSRSPTARPASTNYLTRIHVYQIPLNVHSIASSATPTSIGWLTGHEHRFRACEYRLLLLDHGSIRVCTRMRSFILDRNDAGCECT